MFNASGSVVSEQKAPHNIEKVRVLKEETSVHNLYSGRIYYMNVVGEEVIHPPYAIHYSPYFEHRRFQSFFQSLWGRGHHSKL